MSWCKTKNFQKIVISQKWLNLGRGKFDKTPPKKYYKKYIIPFKLRKLTANSGMTGSATILKIFSWNDRLCFQKKIITVSINHCVYC